MRIKLDCLLLGGILSLMIIFAVTIFIRVQELTPVMEQVSAMEKDFIGHDSKPLSASLKGNWTCPVALEKLVEDGFSVKIEGAIFYASGRDIAIACSKSELNFTYWKATP